jgi:hypothetical protein
MDLSRITQDPNIMGGRLNATIFAPARVRGVANARGRGPAESVVKVLLDMNLSPAWVSFLMMPPLGC